MFYDDVTNMTCNVHFLSHVSSYRFWHSSAAYAIAAEVGCGGSDCLPPPGSEVYKWPHDLIKPDVSV